MSSFWFKPPKLPHGRMSLSAMIVTALFTLPFLAFLIVFIAAYLVTGVQWLLNLIGL